MQRSKNINQYQLRLMALKSKSEEVDPVLIETGKHLANWFQQYGDTENREALSLRKYRKAGFIAQQVLLLLAELAHK